MTPKPAVGVALPERQHTPDNVQLMLYNAALWNGHRIHFDLPYARDVEGYPGLVLAGPSARLCLRQNELNSRHTVIRKNVL